jgi:hypothetical protein
VRLELREPVEHNPELLDGCSLGDGDDEEAVSLGGDVSSLAASVHGTSVAHQFNIIARRPTAIALRDSLLRDRLESTIARLVRARFSRIQLTLPLLAATLQPRIFNFQREKP